VVDGHKRVRCLRRLQRDTIAAVVWEMPESEALIFRQLLHTDATDSAFEQGWLLRTRYEDHGLALDALARRFDRSVGWASCEEIGPKPHLRKGHQRVATDTLAAIQLERPDGFLVSRLPTAPYAFNRSARINIENPEGT
jgi:hypothetical protein